MADDSTFRVLYAEDDKEVRERTAAILELTGFTVTAVENGEQALDALRQAKAEGRKFNAILSDNTMSTDSTALNGIKLLATPEAREVPVRRLHTSEDLTSLLEYLDKGITYSMKGTVDLTDVAFALEDEYGAAMEAAKVASATIEGKKPRILYAEDRQELRTEFVRVLTKAGFEVVPVEDGLQALDRLRSGEQFDILLTDNQMPGLTGKQLLVTEEAKRVPARLLHSADALQPRDIGALGATLVGKPCAGSVLVEAVTAAYKKSAGTDVTGAEALQKSGHATGVVTTNL